MSQNLKKIWAKKHADYAKASWVNAPNIFAQEILGHLPERGRLLDLGAGQGQDTRFFAERGYEVLSMDISDEALQESTSKLMSGIQAKVTLMQGDMSKGLNFDDNSFDIVYAHQSLHYFDTTNTKKLFQEIGRVLKPRGILAFIANSTNDPEYSTGKSLEQDYFFTDGKAKRFYSVDSAKSFTSGLFEPLLVDDKGESLKDSGKGVHNLIRYVGRKI